MWAGVAHRSVGPARGLLAKSKNMKNPKLEREPEEVEWLYDHRDEVVFDKNGKPLTPSETREKLLKRRQSVSDGRY